VTKYCPGATAMGTDTQPYAMVFSLLVILIYFKQEKEVPASVMLLGSLCLVMGALGMMSIPEAGIKRFVASYATYLSLLFIPYAVSLVLKRNNGLNEKLVKICIWIWFFVGLIQSTVYADFGAVFIGRQTTNATRGVVGLAPEPSAYGYVCFFLILQALEFEKTSKFYILLLLVQIFAFAESTVTLLYVAVYVLGMIINNILLRKKYSVISAVALLGGGLGVLYLAYKMGWLPTRMQEFAGYFFTGNWKLLFWDGSLKNRFYAIQNSFIEFAEYYGLPHGFESSRVMSGTGILLIECGIFALAYLIVIGRMIWNAYPKELRFVFVFGFMILMLSAIPFSSPVVCLYLGYCLYKSNLTAEQKVALGNGAAWLRKHVRKYIPVVLLSFVLLMLWKYCALYLSNLKTYKEEMASYEESLVTVEDLKTQLTDEEIAEVYDAEQIQQFLQEEGQNPEMAELVEQYTKKFGEYEVNFSDIQIEMFKKLIGELEVRDESSTDPIPEMQTVQINRFDFFMGLLAGCICALAVFLTGYLRKNCLRIGGALESTVDM
jgi:hypothetical protein